MVNIANHLGNKFGRGGFGIFEITSEFAKNFVNGIGKNIFGRDVAEISIVNFGTIVEIILHAGSSNDKIEREVGVLREFGGVSRSAEKDAEWGVLTTLIIDLFDFLVDFEETGAAR